MTTDSRLILLDPRDNVFVLRARIAAGETVDVEGIRASAACDLPMAHKIARRPIAKGETVLKYGAPIGVATAAIATGEHVHVHNIRSDYTPTYTIATAKGAGEKTGDHP